MAFHPRQNSMLHFRSTFRILSYICYLTSEFTLSSFNFPRATFKFLPCTFTFSYAIFKFSGLHFQVFAFNVEHLPIKFLLSTFDFTYFTCKFALYIQLFKLSFWLNWPSPPPLTLRWKDFLQEWGRETFSSTDSIRSSSCQQDRKMQGVTGHTDSLPVWKHV